VAEWHPNVGGAASDAFYAAFRERFPAPRDDYVHWRMHAMMEMLAAAIERAGSAEALAVSRALEGARYAGAVQGATMRAADHQLHQPLVVSVMERAGTAGVKHDVEGSSFGFRTVQRFESIELPTSCRMPKVEV
jgi:branched-chain amino acid transport system substrate-binding protein